MTGDEEHRWVVICGDTSRMRVPGGWIYRQFARDHKGINGVSMVFVPEMIKISGEPFTFPDLGAVVS